MMITSNNIRLLIFCIILVIAQFAINNLTIFYVDLLAIVLINMLLSGNFGWGQMVVLSLIADLFGHWYLGSHLLALTLLSLFSDKMINFYRMCSWLQRTIVANMFFLILNLIIYLVEVATNKQYNSWPGTILELFVLMPLIQYCLEKHINKKSSEYIFYG